MISRALCAACALSIVRLSVQSCASVRCWRRLSRHAALRPARRGRAALQVCAAAAAPCSHPRGAACQCSAGAPTERALPCAERLCWPPQAPLAAACWPSASVSALHTSRNAHKSDRQVASSQRQHGIGLMHMTRSLQPKLAGVRSHIKHASCLGLRGGERAAPLNPQGFNHARPPVLLKTIRATEVADTMQACCSVRNGSVNAKTVLQGSWLMSGTAAETAQFCRLNARLHHITA